MSKKKEEQSGGLSRRVFLKRSAQAAVALPVAGSVVAAVGANQAGAAAGPREGMKYLFAERMACTGCRACEYACSQFHEEGVTRPSVSRIHVRRYKGIVDVPIICWHCEDAPCVKSCPTTPQAIVKNKETNVIQYIDDKTCLGAKCNKCIEACPAQFLRRHPDTGWPLFCDLCGGDPQCVHACERMADGELAPTLVTKKSGGGVNIAYRDVQPGEAADSLILNLFYPNLDGDRR